MMPFERLQNCEVDGSWKFRCDGGDKAAHVGNISFLCPKMECGLLSLLLFPNPQPRIEFPQLGTSKTYFRFQLQMNILPLLGFRIKQYSNSEQHYGICFLGFIMLVANGMDTSDA